MIRLRFGFLAVADLVDRIGIASMGGETLHQDLPQHYLRGILQHKYSSSDSAQGRSSSLPAPAPLGGTPPPRKPGSSSKARSKQAAAGLDGSRPSSAEAVSPLNLGVTWGRPAGPGRPGGDLGETEPAHPQRMPPSAGRPPPDGTAPSRDPGDAQIGDRAPAPADATGKAGPTLAMPKVKLRFRVGRAPAPPAADATAAPEGGTLRDSGTGSGGGNASSAQARGSRTSESGDASQQPVDVRPQSGGGNEVVPPSTRKCPPSDITDSEVQAPRSGAVAVSPVPTAREPAAIGASIASGAGTEAARKPAGAATLVPSGVQTEAGTTFASSGPTPAATRVATGAAEDRHTESPRRVGTCETQAASPCVFKPMRTSADAHVLASPDMTHFQSRPHKDGLQPVDVPTRAAGITDASSADLPERPQEKVPERPREEVHDRRRSPQRGAAVAASTQMKEQDRAVQAHATGTGRSERTDPAMAVHADAMRAGRSEQTEPARAPAAKEREGRTGDSDPGRGVRKAEEARRLEGAAAAGPDRAATAAVMPLPPAGSRQDEGPARGAVGRDGSEERRKVRGGMERPGQDTERRDRGASRRPLARQPERRSRSSSTSRSSSRSHRGNRRYRRASSRSRSRDRLASSSRSRSKSVESRQESGRAKARRRDRRRSSRSPPPSSKAGRCAGLGLLPDLACHHCWKLGKVLAMGEVPEDWHCGRVWHCGRALWQSVALWHVGVLEACYSGSVLGFGSWGSAGRLAWWQSFGLWPCGRSGRLACR